MATTNLPAVSGILTVSNLSGVPEHTFYLYLKETEFRFNYPRDNLYMKFLNCYVKSALTS
jgi:hypothetical protein